MALAGHLSTRTGRRRFFIGWGLLAVGAGAPLWLWITAGPRPALVAGVGAALLQVVTVCAYGPVGAYINERFPTHVRATGYGIFECVFGVFWFLGSWLMGALYDVNIVAMIAVSVGAQLLALPLYYLSDKSQNT